MRAISQLVFGPPEVLHVVELDRPAVGPSDVLVRVHAAGVNPTDWLHRRTGLYLGTPPFVVGWDVSGVVEAVGKGVTLHKPGDEVFGMLDYPRGAGGYAEYVAAGARNFVRKPAGIDHIHAAALPVVALTAWQALVDTADLQPGQRVLVHAAAGGVGHVAVQVAKALGAYVIGTASGPKCDFVRGLGADEVIDYTRADFAEALRDVDVVLDAVGGDYGPRSLRTLRPGGVLIAIVFSHTENMESAAKEHGVRLEYLTVEADHAGMAAIAGLVDDGHLRVEIDGVLPLEHAAEAHRRGETRRTTGKLVLTVAE
ncbi:NADP-dependent oxidoreductase [Actinocrispum wychmicini]|uniref:NADPH:quinone reductase-like Zn-dependent oxidoreductase n=1 Tax=Actinocrispum wychmicini TaxID=1213861 RepID=A0A4R2ILW3_9PSEU|nr:NADP-dependent oxidoreductase [Actinocrispum wychmicini]TCO45336.1 NADPH:quinone reductase-like Zn-dependent oxidoreductase [Actinocrispum wychmicini]